MGLFSPTEILQFVAWFLALVELILALYILLLNYAHRANQHVSFLLFLFAVNSLGMGLFFGATDVNEAWLPSILVSLTTESAIASLLIVGIIVLKPEWLRGRWKWAWGIAYTLVFLPILLTLLDVTVGTNLWYMGLDADTYLGGYITGTQYIKGMVGRYLRPFITYGLTLFTLVPLLYLAMSKKGTTRQTRRLAWILLTTQVVAVGSSFGLRALVGSEVTAVISPAIFSFGYAYAGFQQMISERRIQRGRLQFRLAALILATAIPILVTVAILLSSRSRDRLRQEVDVRLQTTNQALTANVSLWLRLNLDALNQLVTLPDIVSMDPGRQKPVLETMDAAYPHLFLVHTTDTSGINIARNDAQENKNYSDRIWYQGAVSGAPVTFQSLVSRTTGEPALNMAAPIRDASGEVIGVGSIVSELDDLAQEVQVSRVGETGFAYVVDAENRVIAHPDPVFSAELRDLSDYAPVAALRSGERGLISFVDQDGQPWTAYADVMETGWGVLVQQQDAEFLASLGQLRAISWGGISIGTGMLLLLVWLTVRQVLQPVNGLTSTVSAIASGDLSQRAPVESEDEFGVLARAFNSMTDQLDGLIGGLEQEVADRTRDLDRRARYLETTAQVAQETASVLAIDLLLSRVVSLVSDRFGFDHTGLFILDPNSEWAVLQAASSAGGQAMLARGHRLRVGVEGIVGDVAARGTSRIALDVGEDAVFFDNPDLPETRSEMALPMRARGEVIGVLDVQSHEPEAFTQEDANVLQSLADQVALAISNARLFEQAEASLAAQRRALGQASRESWRVLSQEQAGLGFMKSSGQVRPAQGYWDEEMNRAVQTGAPAREGERALALPIKSGDQVVAVLDAHLPDGESGWTPDQVSLLQALSDQLAQAMERSRLYRDAQRRATQEQVIGEVTGRIRETLEPEAVLEAAANEIREALGLDWLEVRLATQEMVDDVEGGDGDAG